MPSKGRFVNVIFFSLIYYKKWATRAITRLKLIIAIEKKYLNKNNFFKIKKF